MEDVEESEILEKRRGGALDGLKPRRRFLDGTHYYWDQGPRLDTLDNDLSVIFGGRIQLDAATIWDDGDITGVTNEGLEPRRVFLELGAVYRERYEFRFMLDLVDPIDFRDVFVGMLRIPIVGGLRVGYLKEPFGLEEIESSNDITFMERSLTDALVERRSLGVLAHRRLTGARRAAVSLGVFRDTTNQLDVGDGYAVTGRMTAVALQDSDSHRLTHLGVAASFRVPTDGIARYRSKPESEQAPFLVDTGPLPADHELRMGLEAAQVFDSLSFQGEYMVATVDGIGDVGTPVFPSFYVMSSYILTGEHRRYRKAVGAFGRVIPEQSGGAWELAARYSYLDLDSGTVEGGTLHSVTAGLNWYASFYSRVMFNFITAHPEGEGVEHIAMIRLQASL